MNKKKAIKQLNFGYVLFISGIFLGVLIHQKIGLNAFVSAFIWGYFFWSIFWGYKIFNPKISSFSNSPVHIKANGTRDYIMKNIVFKITLEFIRFWICYFVGAFGGAIYKQIQLSKIAYL